MLPYRRKLRNGLICLLMTRAVGLVAPKLLGFCIDYIKTGTATPGPLALFAGLFLMVSLVVSAFLYGLRMNLITASRDMEYDLRNDLFAHLEKLSASFFHRVKTGDIMARATNDLNYVRNFLGPGIMHLAGAIVIPFAAILMFSIDARLAALSLIPVPVVSTVVYLLRRSIHARAELCQAQFSEISALAQENFSGIRVVKAYASEDREAVETLAKYLKNTVNLFPWFDQWELIPGEQ